MRASLEASRSALVEPEWLSVPAPAGYRNRIRLRLDQGKVCFFNPNKSADCAVLEAPLRTTLGRFKAWAERHASLLAPFPHAELRTPDLDGFSGLVLGSPSDWGVGDLDEAQRDLLGHLPEGVLGWVMGAAERPYQRYPITNDSYTFVPLGSFRQVNTELNAALVLRLQTWLRPLDVRRFADVYCGAGNLGLPLMAAGLVGAGTESDAAAVLGLHRAARAQGLDSAGFVALPAEEWLVAQRPGSFDAVIVDPPRAGLKQAADAVAGLEAPQVIVFSCAWAGFERDTLALRDAGYSLGQVCVADMFPHTEHAEVMSRFTRIV